MYFLKLKMYLKNIKAYFTAPINENEPRYHPRKKPYGLFNISISNVCLTLV